MPTLPLPPEETSPQEMLRWASETFQDRFAISTSFQYEGMVLLDMAARISPSVRVLTLDTGRLPEETYAMIEKVRSRYGIRVETISPDPHEVESMIHRHGPNLFREGVAYRKLCCQIRKVRPLARRRQDLSAYAVGLRRDQSESRDSVRKISDEEGTLKLSPLADWTASQVQQYTREYDVPEHPLYAAGYTSIGCEPCTRATRPGESERAGRWWWELEADKECGLHFTPDGKVVRELDVLLADILPHTHA